MIHQGFWNGQPCNYWCVIVKVKSVEGKLPLFWSEAFVGQLRQAVRIKPPDVKGKAMPDFYIDNADGLGMFKILNGGGPQWPHRDLPNVEELKVIESEARWRKVQNWKLYKDIQRKADRYWSKKEPGAYAKMKALEKMVQQRMSKK